MTTNTTIDKILLIAYNAYIQENKLLKGVVTMAEKYTVIKHKVKKLDEAGNPIKNEKGNFVWEEVEKKYRIDAGFKPKAIDEICAEFIDNYIEANDEGEWFVSVLEKKETYKKGVKKGEEKDISFVTIRSAFAHKFFPEIIRGKAEQEMSFRDKMLAKYKKK